MNTVGVIIVDYQSDALLRCALSALTSLTFTQFSVVIVENSPQRPRTDIPNNLNIRFLSPERNLGFGRAVNLARRYLQTPYFLLLNPDVILLPEALSILYNYMEKHVDVGIVAPKLLGTDRKLQLSARTFYSFSSILFRRTPLGKLFPNDPVLKKHLMADWDHNSIREIDWALGACMLIREKAVGGEIFDPRFFLYFEDVDLCLRLRKAGWKIIYHPEAVAIHEHRQKSRKSAFSRANYEHLISWIKFMAKYRGVSGM